ncbi:L,D-transpeptidase family protein [Maritimibacter sp. UBA3975]|uniref:L,D-transpeptidase n=1 Tax=Maritimibacter sp. UBA3975 TaxID=1946833 RepID=UPI000C0A3ECF|nr:L,D-transpeptidase family protein [Maritimibacter sp. UBA3975]MAM61187.1 L,D-transpeptidase [Maritimibacter sp.]|tara:strand:+ start:11215 stop:11814 length:600 start_codon:yes stop_codon:yes gene_type:complete
MAQTFTRRRLLAAASALPLVTPAILRAQGTEPQIVDSSDETAPEFARRNVSSFRAMDWRDHFDTLGLGAIVCDTQSKALHYWGGDGETYRLYPTSVPRSDDLTKRGYTEIVRKKVGPTWTPTASMHERFPDLPDVMPAGPENPLGTHAMYLGWPAYLIHGTHDTRKIGRRSSDGCIGLYNEKIEELFALAEIGTQVRLI